VAKVYPVPLPADTLADSRRKAEILTYRALQEQLGSGWLVFYSCAWLGRGAPGAPPRDGEIDFVVAHPAQGVLLIEVKGGRIRHDPERGQWLTIDRHGKAHEINPFGQVRACRHALIDKFRSLPRWDRRRVPVWYAVAFPDAEVRGARLPLEAPADVILDGPDIARIEQRLGQILDYWHNQEPFAIPDGPGLMSQLTDLLAPRTELPNHLSLAIDRDEREIVQLTTAQFRTLDQLRRLRRTAIAGCAGSGKTLLAVEKARRLAAEGYRTLLTCFNIPLGEHLAAITRDVEGAERLQAVNFHGFCERMIRAAGLALPDVAATEQDQETSRIYKEVFPELLMQAMEARPDLKVDAIVVDEGQDFDLTWWVALTECLVDPGNGVCYVFYDDNQSLYEGRGAIPFETSHCLDVNVRNTRTIHQDSLKFYRSDALPESGGPQGRPVEYLAYEGEKQLRKRLSVVLNRLVAGEGVPARDIVVLTPRSVSRSTLLGSDLASGFRLVEGPPAGPREVEFRSIYRFKGLERPVVVLVDLDERFELQQDRWPELCYVAFSRARSHLICLGRESVLARLRSDLPLDTEPRQGILAMDYGADL